MLVYSCYLQCNVKHICMWFRIHFNANSKQTVPKVMGSAPANIQLVWNAYFTLAHKSVILHTTDGAD